MFIPVTSIFAFTCGDNLTINHTTTGGVAPVNKTVTYGTVLTDLTGENMCWITQNLGADRQALSATDDTEESAGWYWQFNRKQGYKHDGVTRTPDTEWITSINEDKDWEEINDPCTLELGTGWRLPTYTEWFNANSLGGWDNQNDAYASDLKLHIANYLALEDGSFIGDGYGEYWSGTQSGVTASWNLEFNIDYSTMNNYDDTKTFGCSIRCIQNYVTPTSTPTPTPTPTTAPVSQTSNVSSSSSAPSCTAQVPLFAPDLFQIDTTKTKATLWYAPVPNPVTKYFISYGTDKDNLQHGVEYDQGYSSGVLSYTINELAPNTTYYFRIRGGNGCMPGQWNNYLKVKTTNSETSIKKYYRY